MKALNFLQMWFLNVFERFGYDAWLCKIIDKNHVNLTDWAHFLNQKFEPEMVQKYFEGWRYMAISMPFPSTLDRFISDCQEAGIELKLKEQS